MRSKLALRNVIFSLLQQIITVVCGFIVPKMIIFAYGSETNGLISSITQFLNYIVLLDAGFTVVIKSQLYKPIADKDKNKMECILSSAEKFFKTIAKILIAYIIILLFIYPSVISKEYDWLYTDVLLIIISISTFAEYYFGMTYKIFLQTNQEAYIVSVLYIITTILNTLGVVFLIKNGANIIIVKLLTSVVFLIRPLAQNFYVKKKYNIQLNITDKSYKIENKWEGLSQHIASVVHNNTDITVLTFLSTLAEVSVYSVYMLVLKGIKSIIQAFTNGVDASFGDMIAKNEIDNLNKKFNIYEILYFGIVTIIYSCTLVLILPFIKVYTQGISDANYVRPLFGYLIVLSEFIWTIRLPYSSITLSAGHFKETQIGAWVEAAVNIAVSIILVSRYGIVGVAIGTLIAMIIRTGEFVYHSNKYILKRNIFKTIKKIFISCMIIAIVFLICYFLPMPSCTNYLLWLMNAMIVGTVSTIITLLINLLLYKNDLNDIINMIKGIFSRKKVN